MLGEAVAIGTGLLGLWWSLPGMAYTRNTINSIRLSDGVTRVPTPAVLHSSNAATAATDAVHKVCQMLYQSTLYAITAGMFVVCSIETLVYQRLSR
jgi:short subunit fatty acids transporter